MFTLTLTTHDGADMGGQISTVIFALVLQTSFVLHPQFFLYTWVHAIIWAAIDVYL